MNPELLEALVEETPKLLDTRYRLDRCIAATRHGLEVCRYFGVDARPVKTQAFSGNQVWYDWVCGGMPGGKLPDEAWSVGIDVREASGPGRYPGHLVLLAEDDSLLVDLALQQMARPERGMNLPPAAWFAIPSWDEFQGSGAAYTVTEEATGERAYIAYRPLPEKDWSHAANWRAKPPLAGELIRRVRGKVAIGA